MIRRRTLVQAGGGWGETLPTRCRRLQKTSCWSSVREGCCREEKQVILLLEHLRESAACWKELPRHGRVACPWLWPWQPSAVEMIMLSLVTLSQSSYWELVRASCWCAGSLNFKQSQLGVISPMCVSGRSCAIWLKHVLPMERGENLATSLAGEKHAPFLCDATHCFRVALLSQNCTTQ